MTDTPPKTGKTEHSNTKFILPIVVVVVVVAALGFVATQKKGLDKQLVETQLNNWIVSTKQHYPTTSITYGQIEMKGGVSDRHALISDVRVARDIVNDKGEPAITEFAFPEVKIQPKSVMFNAFDVSATQGVQITEDGDKMLIAFDTPPVVRIEKEGSGESQTLSYNWPLTGVWTISQAPKAAQDVADAEAAQEDEVVLAPVTLAFGEASSLAGKYAHTPSRNGEVVLRISSLKALSEQVAAKDDSLLPPREAKPQAMSLSIGAISLDSRWRSAETPTEAQAEAAVEAGAGAASLTVSVQDLFTNEAEMPYGALSLNIDGEYTGPLPKDGQEIDWTSEKALFDLRSFSISAKDVALNAKLNFQTGRGELLPIGEGLIEIKNFAFILSEFRKHSVIGREQDELLAVLAKQITGTELANITDLSLPLKRVDGGSLQVGNSNFEELFAIVLTGGKLAPNTAPVLDLEPEPLDDAEVKELFNE